MASHPGPSESGPPPGVGLAHGALPVVPIAVQAIVGITALVLVGVVTAALVLANPSFATGAAFGTAAQVSAGVPAGGDVARGRDLIASKPCVGCHVIPGVPGATGTTGPSLAGIGTRTTIAGGAVQVTGPGVLERWIISPAELKAGTAMPSVGLTADEARTIVAYLLTLH